MKSRVLAIVAIALAVASSAPAVAQAADPPDQTVSWGVAPADTAIGSNRAHFAYALEPGARLEDALAVVNHTDRAITLRTYASDAFTTTSGALDLLPANQKSTDAGSWITLKAPTITLAAGASAVVPFTVTVPANATPGDHSAGVVTSLLTGASAGPVSVDRRLGARVYLRVGGALAPALKVSGLRVQPDTHLDPIGGGSVRISYTVTNTGNVRLQAHQQVRITGPFGQLGHTAHLADLPELLPGASITRLVTVDGVWPLVHLTARVGLTPSVSADQPPVPTTPVSASRSYWALPWTQLLILVIVALVIVAAVHLQRRRKAKVDAAIAAAVERALETSP